MSSRKLVEKTLNFETPGRLARHMTVLPWAERHYPQVVRDMERRFSNDLVVAPALYDKPTVKKGEKHTAGEFIDEWGCMFDNPESGIIGIPHKPLLDSWTDLEKFEAPASVLSLNVASVNEFCRATDKFVLAGVFQRPFERLQFIRTMERAFVDLAESPPELFELLRRIHELYLKEVELWAKTEVDAISLMDDWGTQTGLLVSPDIFRNIFKPMYREYIEIAKQYKKYVFFHSDGYITEIIPDFIELGVDALNSQVFCMGVRELGEQFRGKLTFWGEVDRQQLLPYGTTEEIRAAALKTYRHLFKGGGFIAQSEFGPGAKPENIVVLFETWNSIDVEAQ